MLNKPKIFRYGLKAAPLFREQLLSRISWFKKLSIEPIIELHLFGSKDLFKQDSLKRCIDNCLSIHSKFYVHFPVQDPDLYGVFDPALHPDSYFETVLDFSQEIKAKAIIMHRVYSLGMDIPRDIAVSGFNEKVIQWAKIAYPMQIYIENYSFIWLSKKFKQEFVLSPLDHFFPWEIREFTKYTKEKKIRNISVMIDIAHAVISCNMFNLFKFNQAFRKDSRFANIFTEDLSKSEFLTPQDFLIAEVAPYLHVSDSFLLSDPNKIDLPLEKYLKQEGLPIGLGNLNFTKILGNLPEKCTLILEVNPPDEDYVNNTAQYEGIKHLQKEIF